METIETPKQKAIREAYGDYWKQCSPYVSDNGWFDMAFADRINSFDILWRECNGSMNRIRPKSLTGIDNNNGWLSVAEHGLPKDAGDYFIQTESPIEDKQYFFGDKLDIERWNKHVTHYHPVIKPLPPIY